MVTMKPSERMGLRLRDLHPGCGGGVVVVGFESKAAGKRAGIKQGDRIVRVEGETRVRWGGGRCSVSFFRPSDFVEAAVPSFFSTTALLSCVCDMFSSTSW